MTRHVCAWILRVAATILLAAPVAAQPGAAPPTTAQPAPPQPAAPQPAPAQMMTSYEARLDLHQDGSARVSLRVRLAAAPAGNLVVPIGITPTGSARIVDGPAGAVATARSSQGQSAIEVAVPGSWPAPSDVTIEFSGTGALEPADPPAGERRTLPAGSRLFRYALLNTQPLTIEHYQCVVRFPDGMRAHAVREWTPKLRKGEAGPRVRLDEVDQAPGAGLDVRRLLQGETAAMTIELIPAARSYTWLVAGVLLSALYLVRFRDLVTRGPASPPPDRAPVS